MARLPGPYAKKLSEIRRKRARLRRTLGRQPTDKELARDTGLPLRELYFVLACEQHAVSLESSQDPDSPGLARTVVARGTRTPLEQVIEAEERQTAESALSMLDARTRRIVESRFGLNGAVFRTLEELGSEVGLTRERVRQLELKGIAQLTQQCTPQEQGQAPQ